MRICIVEKEKLLIINIQEHLIRQGYSVEYFSTTHQAIEESTAEIFLFSTVFSPGEIKKFMKKFEEKTILLLVNHKSNETLTVPLALGANDYFMKPVILDVLDNKIKHFESYEILKKNHSLYANYHKYLLKDVDIEKYINMISFPMIIVTNNIGFLDQLVLEYANLKQIDMVYVSLSSKNWKAKVKSCNTDDTLYLSGLETLGAKDSNILFEMLKNKSFVVSSFMSVDRPYRTVEIITKETSVGEDEILSIADYSLMVLKSMQYRFPDVKIAEKLGYSRKKVASLRKKYNVVKEISA
jgi:CheY-like chemotaxis protein